MSKFEQAIRKRLEADPAIRQLLGDLEQSRLEMAADRAKRDPKSNKLTTVFPPGSPLRWRYYSAGRDGRGRSVRFCYSTARNVAGYFLGWREVAGKESGKRDRWTASKTRRIVTERARARAAAFKAEQAKGRQVAA